MRLTAPEFLPAATGILPSSATGVHEPWAWSFHFISEIPMLQQALLILYFFVALCWMACYRTWQTTIFLWILTVSLHGTNGLINNTRNYKLAFILLLGSVLPLGERWSLAIFWLLQQTPRSHPAADHLQSTITRQTSAWRKRATSSRSPCSIDWPLAIKTSSAGCRGDADAVWHAFHIDFWAPRKIRDLRDWAIETHCPVRPGLSAPSLWRLFFEVPFFAHPLAIHAQMAPALLQLFPRSAYLIQLIAPVLILLPLPSQLARC